MADRQISEVLGDFLHRYRELYGIDADSFLRCAHSYGMNWGDRTLNVIEKGQATAGIRLTLVILCVLNQISDAKLRLADILDFTDPADSIRITPDISTPSRTLQRILRGRPVWFYGSPERPGNVDRAQREHEVRRSRDADNLTPPPPTCTEEQAMARLDVDLQTLRGWCNALFGMSLDETAHMRAQASADSTPELEAHAIVEEIYQDHVRKVKYSMRNCTTWSNSSINLMPTDELDRLEDDLSQMEDCLMKFMALRHISFVRDKRAYDADPRNTGPYAFQPDSDIWVDIDEPEDGTLGAEEA